MNEKHILIGITEDFGTLKDGSPWSGKRIVAQIDRNNKSRQTVILKAAKEVRGLDAIGLGDCFTPLYDRNGRVIAIERD